MQINVGRPKDLEKRQQILSAAKRLFLTCGYHGSSMNHIAQEAGVSKLTVYNHFQDKESLFSCAIAATCEEFAHPQLFQLNAQSQFLSVLQQTCELALNMVCLPEAIKLELLLMELAAEKNPLVHRFFQASHFKMCNTWENFFQQAIDLQFMQADNVSQPTELIMSLLLGVRHHEVILGIRALPTPLEQQKIIQNSIEIFMLRYDLTI